MLASLLDEVGDPSALTIAEKYLGLANALVPKGFRKKYCGPGKAIASITACSIWCSTSSTGMVRPLAI